MIKKVFGSVSFWLLFCFLCALVLLADFLGFIEPLSYFQVNAVRVLLVVSFIILLGNAARK